jgi:hypothetical protein
VRIVYQAENAIDAHLVRHALEAEGMLAFVLGEGLAGGIGELPVMGYCRVVVADEDAEAALACISQLALGIVDDDDAEDALQPLPVPIR